MVPAGRSNTTAQPLMAVVPPLVSVYLPSQPVPQSDVFTKVAVEVAADAAAASQTVPAAATTAMPSATSIVLDRVHLDRITTTSHRRLPNY